MVPEQAHCHRTAGEVVGCGSTKTPDQDTKDAGLTFLWVMSVSDYKKLAYAQSHVKSVSTRLTSVEL